MYSKFKVTLAAVFILSTACMAAAKNDNIPVIDLQKRCNASVQAMQYLLQAGFKAEDAFKTCLDSEQKARDAIVSAWKDMPTSYKTRCIDPTAWSPSYIEWIACLELYIEVKKQRAGQIQQSNFHSTPRCPILDYGIDGSIKSVNACPSITGRRQN
jgi:hypothetical protein